MSPETFADLHKRELVLDAVDKWKGDFERYWSMTAPQTRIVVFDRPFRLADGSSDRWGFWPGLEHPEYQDVVLIWAGSYDLPWLFHELCHRVLHVIHDMEVDEPWWAQWNAADTTFDATLVSRP
jgi:hypothetical protein